MSKSYITPTQENGIRLFSSNFKGEVIMMNLLRLRDVADYSDFPHLKPDSQISGRQAFQIYIDQTLPFLKESGGEILLIANADHFFIGPPNEYWDMMMLIKQKSIQSFMAFANNEACMKVNGHRTAAIIDSRLLPLYMDYNCITQSNNAFLKI